MKTKTKLHFWQVSIIIFQKSHIFGESNLIFCCTGSRENYFGLVGRQNNNMRFLGQHIYK